MLELIVPMLLFSQEISGVPSRIELRDRLQGVTPVTGFVILPPKVPDCRTAEEEQAALEQRRAGVPEMCDPKTKYATRYRR
jgi:hypothetical protein